MPWISKKKLNALEFRLDKLEEFRDLVSTDLYDVQSYWSAAGPYTRVGVVRAVDLLKKDVAATIAVVQNKTGSLPIITSDMLSLVSEALRHIAMEQESIDAALYRDLPDDCKNGHIGTNKKGVKQ